MPSTSLSESQKNYFLQTSVGYDRESQIATALDAQGQRDKDAGALKQATADALAEEMLTTIATEQGVVLPPTIAELSLDEETNTLSWA